MIKEVHMVDLLIAYMLVAGISGKIQGVVVDEYTEDPIPYANVVILGTERGTATDEDGHFFLLDIPPGVYTVEVSCVGFQSKRIEQVAVEIDQTARLFVSLRETPIEVEPVTVTSEMPAVQKDMVGTTYIVRKQELITIPIDYTEKLVTFQPAVARADTALHVRGGRATEVQYMIDNVSILDPQTGDPAIYISREVVDEVIFLPGGFDVEYGRAMSGVINLISSFPSDKIKGKLYGKTEQIMPFYYDFGYEIFQGSMHLPVTKKLKGFVSFDLMHTEDWNPRLYIQPHKQRDDYSVYGKLFISPSSKLKLTVSAAQSRIQFNRYATKWMYNLDNYRSDWRKGDLEVVNITFLPDSRKLLTLNLSRLFTSKIYGNTTHDKGYSIFDDFSFKDDTTLVWPFGSINNPFGVYVPYMPIEGDYPEYQEKSSLIMKAHLSSIMQLHRYHEFKAGFEYTYQEFDNYTYWISSSANPLVDEYRYQPHEYAAYLQDNIDYGGLYAKLGIRFDYFDKDPSRIYQFIETEEHTIDTTEVIIDPTVSISPRIGFSFMVTEKFLFRANIGRYVQPPLYDHLYSNYNVLPFPSYITDIPLIGNPQLNPEKTMSYEIGLQGQIRENLSLTMNTFYKDVSDLIGTRLVKFERYYATYFNVEYANVKGIEWILEFANSIYTGKISYTLSWARGSSSYAEEVYYRYYSDEPDTGFTPPAQEYNLDFDQRHRIFIQGAMRLPVETQLYIFGYLGTGFPYTPPGEEGKTPERNTLRLEFQKEIDCIIVKSFRIGNFAIEANLEIINLLDARYEIGAHYPLVALSEIKPWDFTDYIPFTNSYYHPAADANHDGLITPEEEYTGTQSFYEHTDDWVNANSAPRRARFGIAVRFR
jgi:hypothetical protein